jgi:hypothetical protein
VRVPKVPELLKSVVLDAVPETYKEVVVACEVVAFNPVKFCKVLEPVMTRLPAVWVPVNVSVVPVCVVTKDVVDVELVVVAFNPVKFCKVLDPVTRRFESVVNPDVTLSVPVKLAAEEMVWPLMRPEVMAPAVSEPMVPVFAKKFVVDAVVAKKVVVVAFVEVEFNPVKFWRVVEPLTWRFAKTLLPPK